MMRHPLSFLFFAVLLVACATHLSSTSLRDEKSGQTLSAAGVRAHPSDTDPDNLRYTALWCKGREVLIQAGESVADAGVSCR